jgi:hypothetical protein
MLIIWSFDEADWLREMVMITTAGCRDKFIYRRCWVRLKLVCMFLYFDTDLI